MSHVNNQNISAKIIKTCNEYAFNKSIKTTKNGKKLTSEKRSYYKGIADFLTAPEDMKYM